MDREQARRYIREHMDWYLSQKGIDIQKPFRCLNPEHEDRHPSMRYDPRRHKAHCFSCGADYDTLDLIAIDFHLTGGRDIFARAYEIFRLRGGEGQRVPIPKASSLPPVQAGAAAAQTDLRGYLDACAARIGETDYPRQRGLSAGIVRRFRLGYDPAFCTATGGKTWRALILPTGPDSYVARNTDPQADRRNRYRKQGGCPIFNAEALRNPSEPIFVVEGELDALSILDVSGTAVGLGSTANVSRFLSLVGQAQPQQPFLISLDNDAPGQKAAAQLCQALAGMGYRARIVNICGEEKDANAALVADREALREAVREAAGAAQDGEQADREAYRRLSADHYLPDFLDGIAESVNTPSIPTGFPSLDRELDGGLFEGLTVIGAISSLGKTTLVMQIADQVAASGRDVLIFSLEMARSELMAKSISRLTLLQALRQNGDVREAKTARGITTGSRWEGYSAREKQLIHEAVREYGDFAGNLYIHEGVGDIGVGQVREQVQKHVRYTGQAPVVVVDYIQILAPVSERASDKQNTDRAVLELKRISRDFKTPVIGISSFNRAGYREAVTMEAFKESGAIEYSSDVLIGLQLEGAGSQGFDASAGKDRNPRRVELKILKNRNGPTGRTVAFEYYPMFNYFREA